MPRRLFPVVLGAVGVVLAGTALAWACSPQAGIAISTNTGPPGTPVTITGTTFEDGGPVEIYWNGGGAMLARATGPSFSTTVTIPSAPPDTYTIYAVGKSANGAVAGRASASFTIPGPPTPAPERTPGATPSPAPGGANPSSGTTTGRERARRGSTARSAIGVAGSGARDVSRNPAGAPAGAGTSQGVTTLDSGTSVFADSVTSSVTPKAAARSRQGKGSESSRAAASERSAAGDLWGGFRSDTARGLLAGSTAPAEAPGSVPTLAAALLALGALSALAGVGIAGVRRRRRHAAAGDRMHIDAD